MNHVLNNNNVSCFIHKHSAAKFLPTGQLTNVLPKLKFLIAITAFTPLTVFLIKSITTNKIYQHGARSGFEPELPATRRRHIPKTRVLKLITMQTPSLMKTYINPICSEIYFINETSCEQVCMHSKTVGS